MPKNEVTVNGVRLTREQVEQAYAELNKKVWTDFPNGAVVKTTGGRSYIVVSHILRRILIGYYACGEQAVWVIDKLGHAYMFNAYELEVVK